MSAPRRLWLYVAREVAGYSLLGLVAITTILVGNRLFRWLQDVLGAGIALEDLVAILALFTTLLSVYALPIALLFGILLAIGRMAADSEITAMRASGVGMEGVAVPILAIALALCALLYPITFELEPRARRGVNTTMLGIATRGAALGPGRFEQL
ncbi:MAG: LptF/LptG family permease, partial [Myxococcota bacterium]